MLEFKETSVRLDDGKMSEPFSLVVDRGNVVCLCGSLNSGKSKLLRAILGIEPISNGFITIDGELVTPGSASYFRKMIAYIPQQLPHDNIKVKELTHYVFGLHSNLTQRKKISNLLSEWQYIGLDKSLMDCSLNKLDDLTLQLILMSYLPSLNKEIVLMDNVPQIDTVQNIISQLVSTSKTEVIYTCEECKMGYSKIVNL